MEKIGPKFDNFENNCPINFVETKKYTDEKELQKQYKESLESFEIDVKSKKINPNELTQEIKLKFDIKSNNKVDINSASSKAVMSKFKNEKTNLFNIFKRAKNFSERIKKNIFYTKLSNLTTLQKRYIKDPCYYDLKTEKEQKLKKYTFIYQIYLFLRNSFYKTKEVFPIIKPIHPDNKFKKIWDCFLLIITFINFFLISIDLSFSFIDSIHKTNESTTLELNHLKIANMLIYFIDIIFCFLTGFHEMGKIILNLTEIRRNYLKNYFLWDLIAYISNILFLFQNNAFFIENKIYFLNLFFIFIYTKFKNRLKTFREFLIQEKEDWDDYFSIFILYLKTLFVSHLLACIWYIVGDYDRNREDSWINSFNLMNASWGSKYLNSLYWSLVTMLTVGYGDLTPKNDVEKAVCIMTMLIGFTVFGFTLGSICDIIQKMNNKSKELNDSYKVITRLMKKNNVDFDFQFRVRKYIEYIFLEEKDHNKENEILDKLSKPMKEEFFHQIYGKKIQSIPFFAKNFSQNCLKAISLIIKKVDIAPEEYVLRNKENENSNFYYIFKGSVDLSIPLQKDFHMSLNETKYFNILSFITNKPDEFDIKTTKFCTFYMINNEEFINLLKNNFPLDYEIFCKIKDNILLDKNQSQAYFPCFCCESSSHSITNCPFLHYVPNSDLIITKFNYSSPLKRKKYKRKKIREKINTLKYKKFIEQSLDKFYSIKPAIIDDFQELYLTKGEKIERIPSYEEIESKDFSNLESMKSIKSKNEFEENNSNQFFFKENSENEIINKKNENRETKTKKSTFFSDLSKNQITLKDRDLKIIEKIAFNRRLYGLNPEFDYKNLFDFDFDEKKDFINYYPFFNFHDIILKFKKLMKIRIFKKRKIKSAFDPKKHN